jgi:[ribosomal protein S5]-alanine N-acetyltransferase
LQSDYERKSIIDAILEISNTHFFYVFEVEAILTKAIPSATERIASLLQKKYQPLNKKLMIYDDYFVRILDK